MQKDYLCNSNFISNLMFTVLLFMFTGIVSGYLFRKRKIRIVNGLILTLIRALLFLLGVEVGVNDAVTGKFASLGFEAAVVAVAATLGSVIAAKLLWIPFNINSNAEQENESDKVTEKKSLIGGLKGLKGSLIILLFFATGLLFGIFRWIPVLGIHAEMSFYVLCALMMSVGFSIGHQPGTVSQFKRLPPRVLLLPLTTIAGTLLGVMTVAFFFKHSFSSLLAVGSGFGYYSLSSVLITQCKGAELGTIALLSNIMREILTLLFAPLMVRYFGKLAPVAAGGATTMDTTFPVIIQTAGREFSIVSIYSGFVLDFCVPFLVTLFCSL